MSAAEESSRPSRQIGVYRLDAEIGSGAMGTVYRATHMTLGKQVALKIVHTDDPDSELCQRFLQEGIAASRVRHPNVVEILDAGRDGDTAYLAMQLLEGETLAECLARQGRLPVTYAIDLILPVCAALMAAHDAGVLHRDLKPANIFLTDVGRGEPEPILLDFGISKILGPVDAALTQNPRFLGTPLYIAPEQADGAAGSTLSDQYSLALSLYESLLGVRPYEKYASSLIQLLRRVAEGEIKPARDLDAGIPEELDDALCRALSTDPEERFPSMREFGAALLPFASATRGALWQHSFIDAERTMASASSPVSNSRNSRRVHVWVDDARSSQPPDDPTGSQRTNGAASRSHRDDDDAFISHSALFGHGEGESRDSASASSRDLSESKRRNVERSSISRRSLPPTQKEEPHDPYSQLPSGRPTSESWSGQANETRGERNSVGVPTPSSRRSSAPSNHKLAWILSGLLALATVLAVVTLVRFDLDKGPPTVTYPVSVESIPATARIDLDGLQVGRGHFRAKFAKDGALHRIQVSQPGYEPVVVAFQDEAPPKSIQLRPIEPERAPKIGVSQHGAPAEDKNEPAGAGTSSATRVGLKSKQNFDTARPAAEAGEKISATQTPAAVDSSSAQSAGTKNVAMTNNVASSPAAQVADTTKPASDAQVKEAVASPEKTPGTLPAEKATKAIHTGNLDPWAQ